MSEFTEFLNEVFAEFGAIRARKMFGGYGIYHQGVMFALVDDDSLYLKADEESRAHFESLRLAQFEYVKHTKTVKMSYWQAPEEIYDDRAAAANWATRAYEAALRARSNS